MAVLTGGFPLKLHRTFQGGQCIEKYSIKVEGVYNVTILPFKNEKHVD
jgi:hypothetical protein